MLRLEWRTSGFTDGDLKTGNGMNVGKNLRYRMKTIEGDIFHLSHPRDMNGMHNSEQQRIVSSYEKDVTALSSIEEMNARLAEANNANMY